MAKTSTDYCSAVKQKYEQEKSKKYEGFLFDPTPAKLRDLCLIFFDVGLRKRDEEVFESFFKPKEESGLRKAIEKVDVEKLRTVCNFLKGNSKNTNSNVLNLIAVLVDFESRPFSNFVHSDGVENSHPEESKVENNREENDEDEKPSPFFLVDTTKEHKVETVRKQSNNWSRNGVIALTSIGVLAIGYTAKNMIFPTKECMKWCEDHYELVDCIQETQGVESYGTIVPYDEREFKRRELSICDTTEFFVDGNSKKPKVWYDKEKDGLRCFNMNGVNPETGDHLRPMTVYMIGKHVESCE